MSRDYVFDYALVNDMREISTEFHVVFENNRRSVLIGFQDNPLMRATACPYAILTNGVEGAIARSVNRAKALKILGQADFFELRLH